MAINEFFNLDLQGRTALVCGGSAGIGEASARALASLGARVILCARSEENLQRVLKTLPAVKGGAHRAVALDLSDHALVRTKITAEIAACGGTIEILVNNSAGPKGGPILEARAEEFTQAFAQHLITGQLLVQLLVPGMKQKNFGRIVNIISTSVRVPIPGLGVSNTIRAAVASWAKTLSLEVAPFGITVNSVLPGYTKTDRLTSLLKAASEKTGKTVDQVAEEWKATTPARRFGEPEELGAAVAFLASPASGYITGIVLPVDGGRLGTI
jgi:3-oxoacyl-[acyl-carrier protein] reductase